MIMIMKLVSVYESSLFEEGMDFVINESISFRLQKMKSFIF
jgi:hypothetical protein